MDDWREQFLPGEPKTIAEEPEDTGTSELGHVLEEGITGTDREGTEASEPVGEPFHIVGGPEKLRSDPQDSTEQIVADAIQGLADNQQRMMMAIDQMASGFSNQLVILARRIDNFERILEQSQGQPPMTNLMYDAPEVFNKVVNREDEGAEEEVEETRAVEPRVPVEGFEIPDEVEHLLNFSADFPVSVEVQAAFYMWKEKIGTFNEFVKVAGGPVAAKQARSHLE